MENRNELAADTINGVYVCENGNRPVMYDWDFYEALGEGFDGVIYGNVTDEIAEKINQEYGIK